MYKKLLKKDPPKTHRGVAENEEDELLESITNLDNLLIKNKLKNEEELTKKKREERGKAKKEEDRRKREEERRKKEDERISNERERLERLRLEN